MRRARYGLKGCIAEVEDRLAGCTTSCQTSPDRQGRNGRSGLYRLPTTRNARAEGREASRRTGAALNIGAVGSKIVVACSSLEIRCNRDL